MKERNENSLQTAARWGGNLLIAGGILYALYKIVELWLEIWWHLFPGIRKEMRRKYGEQDHTEFMARAAGCFVASPFVLLAFGIAFTMFLDMAGLDAQFGVWWEKFWHDMTGADALLYLCLIFGSPVILALVLAAIGAIVAACYRLNAIAHRYAERRALAARPAFPFGAACRFMFVAFVLIPMAFITVISFSQ